MNDNGKLFKEAKMDKQGRQRGKTFIHLPLIRKQHAKAWQIKSKSIYFNKRERKLIKDNV